MDVPSKEELVNAKHDLQRFFISKPNNKNRETNWLVMFGKWKSLSPLHCVKSVQIRGFLKKNWSIFSYIRNEYGNVRSKSPYSVRIQENRDQNKLRIWTLFTQCYWQQRKNYIIDSWGTDRDDIWSVRK